MQIGSNDYELFEIVSENRLSCWNGKFSVNDAIWNRIDLSARSPIFNSMKNNRSFCMEQDDISRIFSDILIFENKNFANKDWIENVSTNGVTSFSQFFLKQKDQVYIRITTKNNISQSLILA